MKKEKAQILVLGSFHMAEQAGLHSEKRQAEIEEFVDLLVDFQPTKIAVEMVPEDQNLVDEQFKQYKNGTRKLEMNEIDQVGYRLAFKLGHNRMYPTDWMGPAEKSFQEVESWAKEHQPELLEELFKDAFVLPELTNIKTILDYYKELNDPAWLNKLHKIYVNVARIGHIDNNVGMEWLSWWYKRNLIMFANLTRLIESKDERILFIVGASHSSIVTKFLEESDVCEVVPPIDWLS